MTAEHIPLRCSLLELVTQRHAEPQSQSQSQSQAMEMELSELLDYLRNAQDLALTPLQSILLQTGSIGDPAQPGVESGFLQWLGEAFNDWEQHHPLESSLHRIIDSLQLGAVGWQASLGRAGEALQKQMGKAVDDALAWFEDSETDLEAAKQDLVSMETGQWFHMDLRDDEPKRLKLVLRKEHNARRPAQTPEITCREHRVYQAGLRGNW